MVCIPCSGWRRCALGAEALPSDWIDPQTRHRIIRLSPDTVGSSLIDIGTVKSERLVDMSHHNYSKETGVKPNLTFTPDGKWIIFANNFHPNPGEGKRTITHTYAVEIAKHDAKN